MVYSGLSFHGKSYQHDQHGWFGVHPHFRKPPNAWRMTTISTTNLPLEKHATKTKPACIVGLVLLHILHHMRMWRIFRAIQLGGQHEECPSILRFLDFQHDFRGDDLKIAGQLGIAGDRQFQRSILDLFADETPQFFMFFTSSTEPSRRWIKTIFARWSVQVPRAFPS